MDPVLNNYTDAIITLVKLAQGDTGGSRVAAQVLLSAFNGDAFQLNIVDLGNLDENHYQAALVVITGRIESRIEPHTLLKGGEDIFAALWVQWEKLHVKYRGLPYCSKCEGSGRVPVDPSSWDNYDEKTCPACDGVGFIKPE